MSWLLLINCSMCGQLLPKMQISPQVWCNSLWSCSCTFWFSRACQWLLDSAYIFILKWWHQGPLSHLSLCSIPRFSPSPTLPSPLGNTFQSDSWVGNIIHTIRPTWYTSIHLLHVHIGTFCIWAVNLQKDKIFSQSCWAELHSQVKLMTHMICLYLALIYCLELRGFGHDTIVQ